MRKRIYQNAVPVILHVRVARTVGRKPLTLTQEDVWGKRDVNNKLLDRGMVIARSGDTCPHWGDIIPYKSVTVVCNKEQEDDVRHWLSYVHGGDSVSRRMPLKQGKIALRSDYQCW